MRYWLMKSEPDTYSIDDLKRDCVGHWDGVRNYQARNYMRDQMHIGDLILFYHSNAKPPGVVGIAKVCKEAYPDHTAQDPNSKYFDSKASDEDPRWMMVDIEYVTKFPRIVSLDEMRDLPSLAEMVLLKKGMRLSIQPVTAHEFEIIQYLAYKVD